jgi:ribosomal protein S18 acetylase RimI-like enzyme
LHPTLSSQAINAAYALGDMEFFPHRFEIGVSGGWSKPLALVLRRPPIHLPLGDMEAALDLMASAMDRERFFVRIPPEWAPAFTREFAFEWELHQLTFCMELPDDFNPQESPTDLEVKMALTRADVRALASYYEVEEEEFWRTVRSHPRVLGIHRGTVVSVARTNAAARTHAVLGGVHTRRMFRGRGYARAVSSAWTGEILRRGKTALLETDVGNTPALHIYRTLGYREFGENRFFEKGSAIIAHLRSRN